VKRQGLTGYRYLHFATHGILGNQIPGVFEPALVLAAEPEGSGQDGFLTLGEVQQLKLGSELTVLSACDTGSGKYFTGEGVMGLSRGFLLAGSRSVIMSLWPVASDATVQLMGHFYRNLHSGKSKSESLRKAQLSLMGNWTGGETAVRGRQQWQVMLERNRAVHPFYWAAFVLIGE
jgi:CHAT domain-containing protein